MWREPSKDDEALPRLLVVGISLIGIGLLIANTALVAWFIIRKRIKGKKTQHEIFIALFSFQVFSLFLCFCWLFAILYRAVIAQQFFISCCAFFYI